MEVLAKLTPAMVHVSSIAGESIQSALTTAPGNGAPIGGLKVVIPSGWFAIRPSGTEPVYKIYAESLKSDSHLAQIFEEAHCRRRGRFHGKDLKLRAPILQKSSAGF